MINVNDLVVLKKEGVRKGQVSSLHKSDDVVTCWVKWDGGFMDEHKEHELRVVGTMYNDNRI